ncbi:uncharacterized protein LOC108425413 isoform X1 [Tachysurus ichikawai]
MVPNWEKRLQIATDKDNVDDFCSPAQSQIKLYKEKLPKLGDMMQNKAGQSSTPLFGTSSHPLCYCHQIKSPESKNPQNPFQTRTNLSGVLSCQINVWSKKEGEEQKGAAALADSTSPQTLPPSPKILHWFGSSMEKEKEATLFFHQGLESVMVQYFNSHGQVWREQKPDAGNSLSIVNAQFLRGCLSLGAVLHKHTDLGQTMSSMLVYQNVALMAVKAPSMCVGQGQVTQHLEKVLLDAHFASLKLLLEQENIVKQAWMTKRCQALSALIRLSCIDTCS